MADYSCSFCGWFGDESQTYSGNVCPDCFDYDNEINLTAPDTFECGYLKLAKVINISLDLEDVLEAAKQHGVKITYKDEESPVSINDFNFECEENSN